MKLHCILYYSFTYPWDLWSRVGGTDRIHHGQGRFSVREERTLVLNLFAQELFPYPDHACPWPLPLASGSCFLSWQVPFLASFLQNFWQERHLQKRLENRDSKAHASSIPILALFGSRCSSTTLHGSTSLLQPNPAPDSEYLITLSLPARLLQSLPRFSILSVSLSLSLQGLERPLSSYWILM